jgi:hypothetical protein
MVIVMAGLNVAEAAPASWTSTAPEVEATVVKPAGAGTPPIPEKVADESAGTVKVKEGGAVSALMVPSPFFAVMIVLGGSVALTVARYPCVPGGAAAVELLAPVDAVPSGLTVAAIGAFTEGFISPDEPSPPQPTVIIKAPRKAIKLNVLNDLRIVTTLPTPENAVTRIG